MEQERREGFTEFKKKFAVHFPDDPEKGIYGKINEIKTCLLLNKKETDARILAVETKVKSRQLLKKMVGTGFISLCVAIIVVLFKLYIIGG